MMVSFRTPNDISDITFKEVENQVENKGHKFFCYSKTPNVLLSEPHNVTEGATYIASPAGFYRTYFGDIIKRPSIIDIDGLIRNVKSESRRTIKKKGYSVRKLTTKGKVVSSDDTYFACFNLDYNRFKEYRKKGDFFKIIAEYLNGDRSEFLGTIDGGLHVEPIRFGDSRKSLDGIILTNKEVGILRLNNGTYYSCDEIPKIKRLPVIVKPSNNVSTENWMDLEDRGMQLFLDAHRYELKAKQ